MRQSLLSVLLAVLICNVVKAQNSDLYYIDNRGRDALLAPRIGIGGGVFTYFGDVNDNNYEHVFTSSYGVELLASANLSRYFDLNLTGIYGNIAINERSSNRNMNFKSELYIASIGLSYNFNHLYKKPGIIQPFIGFGVSFISFDSKSDRLDANGNAYHYWSNGAIMSLAEDDPQAEQAVGLQRDYTYETDLRQANLDGLGKYDLFTFSLPVTAGVDFKLGKRFSSKISAGFYYTFTDLIDDISDEGEGDRMGDSRNDMFLFSSISLSYSIGVGKSYTKSLKTKYYEDVDFYAMQLSDSDEDGVNDFDDKCALTPAGVKVDEHGCPLDSDTDVIADYRDKESTTELGSIVNLDGVTLTDEMILASYDSVAVDRAKMHDIYPSGIIDRKPAVSKVDSVKLAVMMLNIQQKVESEGEFDKLFDEINKEIFSQPMESASSVDQVYNSVDQVYKQMVKEKKLTPKKPLAITKEENIGTTIPPEFRDADYNSDGLITASEVHRIMEEVLDGSSSLTVMQLYNLVDFYYEYMEDAKAIDFGGTMAVYIDGTLKILENYKRDGLSDSHRYLANKFPEVDFNGDGKLVANEVNMMISLFQNGETDYTEEMILELIDLFFID